MPKINEMDLYKDLQKKALKYLLFSIFYKHNVKYRKNIKKN